MKKLLFVISLAALMCGCSKSREWSHEQRKQMRQDLREYRDMVYLSDLDDVEFDMFSDGVAVSLEEAYPVYATFIAMPGVDDTVTMVVVEAIVTELEADAHNMRHLFPYRYLIEEGILPKGLSHQQLVSYYSCLASKVNGYYDSVESFLDAILSGTSDTTALGQFQRQCAVDFDDVEMVEVDETVVED